jgi:hypothetical protein
MALDKGGQNQHTMLSQLLASWVLKANDAIDRCQQKIIALSW